MAKEKKKGFFKEFKEFAISGNMFDMAIGIIIGGVFKGLVDSFTNNIIMPIIAMFTGGVRFEDWKVKLPDLFNKAVEAAPTDAVEVVKEAEDTANYLKFGEFISAIISFLILMLVVFLLVKGVNKLRKVAAAKKAKEEEEKKEEAPPEPTKEEKLLTEIRDLLAQKK